MAIDLRSSVAAAVVLFLATAAIAQTQSGTTTRGTTPGSGMIAIDLTNAPSCATGVSDLQTPQPAERLGQTDGPWTVIAPYGWVPGIRGTVGAGRRTASVDESVADTVDAVIRNLKGVAEIHVESGYGPVGVIADLLYLRLAPGVAIATVDSRSTIFELLGMYRVLDTGGREAGALTFDLLGGIRYYRFSNSISGNVFGLLSAERENKWTDLVVGARTGVQVTDDLGIFARGDIGGFGIGDSSRRAFNVVVGFEYRCCDCASLAGGYRWFTIDRENGLGRDRFVLDATLAGPFVAFALRF
jgi:hypothetical protein